MGYQESMLVCKKKRGFIKLCKKLNSIREDISDFIDVFSIGIVKKDLLTSNGVIKANSYFVWIGGERHPFQSSGTLVFKPNTIHYSCICCDNIINLKEELYGLDLKLKKGELQENQFFSLLELPIGNTINEESLQKLL